nr:acyltransferase [Micromonospora sp. DSM 115978]
DSLSPRRSLSQVAAGAVRSAAMQYLSRRDPVGFARRVGVTVGSDCRFIGVGLATFGSEPYLVRLGDHVAIASGVRFLTHDGGNWLFQREYPDLDVAAPIVVGDNVMLGINSMIYRGVTIGDDVAVAAGALVMRDVPPGSVVAGAPARVISSLDDYRRRLLRDSIGTGLLRGDERRRRLLEIYPTS